ncbi:uncharacterized protein LOC122509881 [Leptopilina heterotoma]|uniref:uncharacterized protein LOC122509881 n=1 Tax=Leptopilina heterotoma TaxID=63436 RepID=UPI001CA9C336|nr:uncharacterized protein LOC122509881 [Leptopilina heterotoma]
MIRIAIICFLVSIVRSQDCVLNSDELNEVKQIFKDADKSMEEATKNQSANAAIVIGTRRSGKSTLINYLMGNELTAFRRDKFEDITIRKTNENTTGPEISTSVELGSKIPTKWSSRRPELQNVDLWDTPSILDSSDPVREFSNALYLYHLIRRVESLKLILDVNFNSIFSDDIYEIILLLNDLDQLFNGMFKDFFPSISLIISKAPYQHNEATVDHEYVSAKLNSILESNLVESQVLKDFIQHITDNKKSVGIFRLPKDIGNLAADIDDNIIPAINNAQGKDKASHQNMGISITERYLPCLQHFNDLMHKE